MGWAGERFSVRNSVLVLTSLSFVFMAPSRPGSTEPAAGTAWERSTPSPHQRRPRPCPSAVHPSAFTEHQKVPCPGPRVYQADRAFRGPGVGTTFTEGHGREGTGPGLSQCAVAGKEAPRDGE